MKILITGATGKVGQHFINQFRQRELDGELRAFCHSRELSQPGVEVVKGDLSELGDVKKAMEGVSHVIHMATVKETPELIMDVSIKGLFWLLEECVASSTFKQFILIGGDAAIGHFFYEKSMPVKESDKRTPYPGCYALSKALEEDMLDYYHIQYGLNVCCLRAPWIMEKDDLRYALSFGKDQFGGPPWESLIGLEKSEAYHGKKLIPVLLDKHRLPLKRNFIHINDLTQAIMLALDHPNTSGELINIAMEEPFDYLEAANYIHQRFGLDYVEIPTAFNSIQLDIGKAKAILDWQPSYQMERMVDEAFSYQRHPQDLRKVWYPG